jgi:hypothetical protein
LSLLESGVSGARRANVPSGKHFEAKGNRNRIAAHARVPNAPQLKKDNYVDRFSSPLPVWGASHTLKDSQHRRICCPLSLIAFFTPSRAVESSRIPLLSGLHTPMCKALAPKSVLPSNAPFLSSRFYLQRVEPCRRFAAAKTASARSTSSQPPRCPARRFGLPGCPAPPRPNQTYKLKGTPMTLAAESGHLPVSAVPAANPLLSQPAFHPILATPPTCTAGTTTLAINNEFFDQLLNWEQGLLGEPETMALFQKLVSSGLAWKSNGAVRRTAAVLVRQGRIQPRGVGARLPAPR